MAKLKFMLILSYNTKGHQIILRNKGKTEQEIVLTILIVQNDEELLVV